MKYKNDTNMQSLLFLKKLDMNNLHIIHFITFFISGKWANHTMSTNNLKQMSYFQTLYQSNLSSILIIVYC